MDALRTRELLHAALCLLLLAVSAGAHSGGPVYPVPYLTDGMLADIRLADGSVDEWYDLVGEPTMTPLGFEDGVVGAGTRSGRPRLRHLARLARRPRPPVPGRFSQRRPVQEHYVPATRTSSIIGCCSRTTSSWESTPTQRGGGI